MLSEIPAYFLHIPRLLALEVYRGEAGNWLMHAAILKRVGRTIKLERDLYAIDGTHALLEAVPRSLPVVICLSGKGLINRVLPIKEASDGKEALGQLLPGAHLADFYIQETPAAAGILWSAVRQSTVDELLAMFGKIGMRVLSVSLGPFALLSFGRLLPENPMTELNIGRHRLVLNEEWNLLDYTCLQEEPEPAGKIMAAGEVLNRRIFPAFSTGCCVLGELDYPAITIPDIAEERQEYQQQLFFKRSATGWLGLLLCLLLANTYFFLYYSDGVAGLEQTDMRAVMKEIDSLKKQLAERDSVMEAFALDKTGSMPMAWMADQLAHGLPSSMRLTELMVHPPDELNSRAARRPVFTRGVRISGTCQELMALNEWMDSLRQLGFCSQLNLAQYAYDEKEKHGNFTLVMRLKE